MSTEPSDGIALRGFQQPMRALVDRVREIDVRTFELADVARVALVLKPVVLEALAAAAGILGRVLQECAGSSLRVLAGERDVLVADEGRPLPFERAIDATVAMATMGSHEAVEEVTFIAELELRERARRLRGVTVDHGVVILLGECDSSLRRVRKALTAVDAAIAGAEGVPALLDFASELKTSLAVRRAYAKLRAGVLANGEPTAESIRARVRQVGTQLAVLVGWEVYAELRIRDRLLLRELQQRVLEWLRQGAEGSPEEGIRLWRDVASSVEMFALVSRRQELVEHDRGVLRGVASSLAAADAGARVKACLEALGSLAGLAPELDELLSASTPPPASAIRAVVERLGERLGYLAEGGRRAE